MLCRLAPVAKSAVAACLLLPFLRPALFLGVAAGRCSLFLAVQAQKSPKFAPAHCPSSYPSSQLQPLHSMRGSRLAPQLLKLAAAACGRAAPPAGALQVAGFGTAASGTSAAGRAGSPRQWALALAACLGAGAAAQQLYPGGASNSPAECKADDTGEAASPGKAGQRHQGK